MHKVLVSLMLIFVAVNLSFSQEIGKSICFISSNPEMHLETRAYLSLIYELKNDSLVIKDTLTTDKRFYSKYIRIDRNSDIAFYYEEDIYSRKKNCLKVIDLTTAISSNQVENINSINLNPWPSIVVKDSKPCFNLIEKIFEDTIKYYGYLQNLDLVEIKPNEFNNLFLSGFPGAPVKNFETQILINDFEEGKLKLPLTRGVSYRPNFDISLPSVYREDAGKRVKMYLNTDKILAVKISQNVKGKNSNDKSLFLVYNKEKSSWFELIVDGNRTKLQSFDEWMSGVIISHNLSNQKNVNGIEERKGIQGQLGPSFDIIAKVLKLYYPGKLFLYNIKTNRYLEWETGQADSEVLLVSDEKVYYRVYNKIYRAQIIKGEEIGSPELIVHDYKIPYIHWAFVSGRK